MYMKNFILNLSIILVISCGPKNSESTEEILATSMGSYRGSVLPGGKKIR